MFLLEYVSHFIDFVLRDPFAQITGFCAMITTVIAYFQKDDFTVKKLMLLSSLFWGTHFYLLWVYAWLAAVIIFIFRLVLSLKFQRNKRAFFSIIGVTLITWYFTFDGIFSLLPIITSISWAYSFFFLEKIKLRLAMMFNSALWLVYQVSIGSISGMINEWFVQVILIMTVYRMLHPEWGTRYYANKVRDILWNRSRPDFDRFIFIHDKVSTFRHTIGTRFLEIIHYDIRNLFKRKPRSLIEKLSDTKSNDSNIDKTLKNLHITK